MLRLTRFLLGITLLFLALPVYLPGAPAPQPRYRGLNWDGVRHLGQLGEWYHLLGISPDGRQLMFRAYSRVFFVYDLPSGKVMGEFKTKETIQSAAISPDGKLLATAEWQDGVKLRDYKTKQELATLKGSGNLGANQVDFTPDGKYLVVSSWWASSTQLWAYDLKTRKVINHPVENNQDTATRMVRSTFRGSNPLLFSVEYERANGKYTGYRVWTTDPVTGKKSKPVKLGNLDYFQFDITSTGRSGVVMQPGEDARIVDFDTGRTTETLKGHKRWVSAAKFSPNNSLLATASGMSDDGYALVYTSKRQAANAGTEILLRNVSTGRILAKFSDSKKNYDFSQIGFSPTGRYLYAITHKNEILLWGNLPAIAKNGDPIRTRFEREFMKAK